MTVLDDLTTELERYGADHVTLEIINVVVPGTALNEDEVGSFDVRVINTGPLRMNDLTLRIKGLNGVLVKDAAAIAPFVTEFVTSAGQFPTIAGHNGNDPQENIGGFGFKAPPDPQPVRDLFEVSLESWNADLDHLLDGHSRGDSTVKATYRDRVRAA